jgi:cation-dependent mannose-6-phosphate receptor
VGGGEVQYWVRYSISKEGEWLKDREIRRRPPCYVIQPPRYLTAQSLTLPRTCSQQSSQPLFRGRKLVLNYTNGSPCPDVPADSLNSESLNRRKALSDSSDSTPKRTKSTILSFLCDPSPLTNTPSISFVGTPDSCAYFFEVRSASSCGGHASDKTQTLSPLGVFGIIAAIAVAAYLIGGCAYQRIVLNQRGWRQCPNGALWRGLFGFVGVGGDSHSHSRFRSQVFSGGSGYGNGHGHGGDRKSRGWGESEGGRID